MNVIPVRAGRGDAVDVLYKEFFVNAFEPETLFFERLFDFFPALEVCKVEPFGAESSLVAGIVRSPRTDYNADFWVFHCVSSR